MTLVQDLPDAVVDLLSSASRAEFATVSAAGVPIDTPVLFFPSEGLHSIDLATGLSYPAKAERARRNPKVGLLIEGGPTDPVISIAGLAAVRDADLQANAERYLSEAGHTLPGEPDWALAREAVWYWTRIIIEVVPARVLWWDSPSKLDEAPLRWSAPADAVYPQSDPTPPGAPSEASNWRQAPWRELAAQALEKGGACHLTVTDEDGFPMPMSVGVAAATDEGFTLEFPPGAPWRPAGKATLTFNGLETFVGEVVGVGRFITLRVERALPVLPMTQDMNELWTPGPETRANLMRRLRRETERRGQPIPSIPFVRPQPTSGYRRRMARYQSPQSAHS